MATTDIINLTKDGQVTKRILVEGKGTLPGKNDTISVHYEGFLVDSNTKFDSSRDRKAEFTFTLNSNEVIKSWELAIATMKVGEKAEVITTSDYGYGDEGQQFIVPPKAKLRYEIELIGHWEPASSAKERIAAAEKKKQEGNDLFRQGMTEQALFAYRKAREYIKDLWNCEPDETIKCRQLIVMIQLNIAACHLKMKNYDFAIEVCKRALDRDSASLKAYYRLGQAYLEKGDFDQSLSFINMGLEHRPSDPSLNALRDLVLKKHDAWMKSSKSIYKKMFKSPKKEEKNEEKEESKEEPKKEEEEQSKKEEEESKEEEPKKADEPKKEEAPKEEEPKKEISKEGEESKKTE